LFHCVHSTGLPWVLSIPVTAAVVRAFVGVTQQLWMVEQQRRMSVISPMLIAWTRVYREELKKKEELKNKEKPEEVALSAGPESIQKDNRELVQATKKAMYKSWRIKSWANYTPIALLPLWLSMIEALRRMSGFRSLFGSENTTSAPLEPSLATEGALWFSDLLVADPYYVLPVILSATIYKNIISGWKKTTDAEMNAMASSERSKATGWNYLRRFLQCAALASGPMAWYHGVPAGVLIYWISSTNIATFQRWLLSLGRGTRPPKIDPERGIATLKTKSAAST
jgi:inner membrane protein COX18